MSRITQKDKIKAKLREDGEVSRNWCLERHISRLGAIAWQLRDEGWQLEGKWRRGDYVYKLINRPSVPHVEIKKRESGYGGMKKKTKKDLWRLFEILMMGFAMGFLWGHGGEVVVIGVIMIYLTIALFYLSDIRDKNHDNIQKTKEVD